MEYHVTWEIDIEADSPREAARCARELQLDQDSTATIFEVQSSDLPAAPSPLTYGMNRKGACDDWQAESTIDDFF